MKNILLFLSLVSLSCVPFGRYRPDPLVDLGKTRDPMADFIAVRAFIEANCGTLVPKDGHVTYVYDSLVRVYDLGDSYLRVFPHNFDAKSFSIQLVAGRLKDGHRIEELLSEDLTGNRQFELNALIRPVATNPAGGLSIEHIAIGDNIHAVYARYSRFVVANENDKELARQNLYAAKPVGESDSNIYNFDRAQLIVLYARNAVFGFKFASTPPAADWLYRARLAPATMPTLLQGELNISGRPALMMTPAT